MRIAHSELIYTLDEFRTLSVGEICRRYNWGDWLDSYVNEQAERELTHGSTE